MAPGIAMFDLLSGGRRRSDGIILLHKGLLFIEKQTMTQPSLKQSEN